MTQPSAVELWNAIKAWYAEHLPEVLGSLNPGISERTLSEFEDELEQEVGQRLPQSLRDVYLQNNGQDKTTVCGIFFGLEFLSLENLIDNWNVWKDIASDSFYDDLGENSTSYPPETLQTVYAHTGWIPFAYDGGGNHIGIDLSPGPAGQIGQVINFGSDEDNKFVMAPSFETFLRWQLTQLQSGNFRIVAENYGEGPERHLVLGTPQNSHLLDAIPKLFGPKEGFLNSVFSAVNRKE